MGNIFDCCKKKSYSSFSSYSPSVSSPSEPIKLNKINDEPTTYNSKPDIAVDNYVKIDIDEANVLEEAKLGNVEYFSSFVSSAESLRRLKLVKADDETGDSILHRVVRYGHAGLMVTLTQKLGGVNRRNKRYDAPIHSAVARRCDVSVLTALKKAGADLEALGGGGDNFVALAQYYGEEKALRMKNDFQSRGFRENALHTATRHGDASLVERLLSFRVKTGVFDPYGNTPLHIAVEIGHDEIVELIIGHAGAGVIESRNQFGQTALHVAADNKCLTTARILLQRGADVNAKQYGVANVTSLSIAVQNGDEDIVELLKRFGANLISHYDDHASPFQKFVKKLRPLKPTCIC